MFCDECGVEKTRSASFFGHWIQKHTRLDPSLITEKRKQYRRQVVCDDCQLEKNALSIPRHWWSRHLKRKRVSEEPFAFRRSICDECGGKYGKSKLNSHLEGVRAKDGLPMCPALRPKMPKEQFYCDDCGLKRSDRLPLYDHWWVLHSSLDTTPLQQLRLNYHSATTATCDDCSYQSKRTQVATHWWTNHTKFTSFELYSFKIFEKAHKNVVPSIACDNCIFQGFPTKLFLFKCHFLNHWKKKHCQNEQEQIKAPLRPIVEVRCDECGVSTTSNGIKGHLANVHSILPKNTNSFTCEICQSSFESHYRIGLHWESGMHNSRNYRTDALHCDLCDKSSHLRGSMIQHLLRHSRLAAGLSSNPEEMTKCDECFLTVKGRKTLKRHIQRDHRGLKISTDSYKCDYCALKFNRHLISRHVLSCRGFW